MAPADVPSDISTMSCCHCGSSPKMRLKRRYFASSSAMPSAAASACRRKPTFISRCPAKPVPRSRTWLQPRRACRVAFRSAPRLARPKVSPFARSTARPTERVERVVVEVTAPKGAPVDLFVEGPTADWALPLPEPQSVAADNAPGIATFRLRLDGLPPGAVAKGATLTFTAVSPTDAIEVQAHLD